MNRLWGLIDAVGLLVARRRPVRPHCLIGVGGGDAAGDVLAAALRETAGTRAKICVIGAAGKEPVERGYKSAKVLRKAGFVPVVLDLRPHGSEVPALRRARHLRRCAAIYFAGGSQVLLARAMRGEDDYPVLAAVREAARRGTIIAGTSAGAAVLGADMITTGGSHDSLSDGRRKERHMAGFRLLDGVVVDQHFIARGHLGRLIAFLRRHDRPLGLGIDEGAAVVFAEDGWRVLGKSHAVLIEMPDAEGGDIHVSLLAGGERYDPMSRAIHGAADAEPVPLDDETCVTTQTDVFGREALSAMLKRMVEARAARAFGLSLPPESEAEDAVDAAWRLRFQAGPFSRAYRWEAEDVAGWSVHRLALSIEAVEVRLTVRGRW